MNRHNEPIQFEARLSKSYANVENAQKAIDKVGAEWAEHSRAKFKWLPVTAEDNPTRIIPVILMNKNISPVWFIQRGFPVVGTN